MTGDYMLLLILCIPFAGALVTLLLRGGEKGAGESSDGKKKRDIWTGLITAAEMLIFASLFVIFLESAFLLGNAYFNAERLQAGFILGLRPRKDAFSRWPRSKNSTLVNPKEHIFLPQEKRSVGIR